MEGKLLLTFARSPARGAAALALALLTGCQSLTQGRLVPDDRPQPQVQPENAAAPPPRRRARPAPCRDRESRQSYGNSGSGRGEPPSSRAARDRARRAHVRKRGMLSVPTRLSYPAGGASRARSGSCRRKAPPRAAGANPERSWKRRVITRHRLCSRPAAVQVPGAHHGRACPRSVRFSFRYSESRGTAARSTLFCRHGRACPTAVRFSVFGCAASASSHQ